VEKPPWDGLRAAFYLVATVILLQVLTTIAAGVWCFYTATPEVLAGRFECNKDGRLTELLAASLTSALAFAMAFLNRKEPPK